MRKRGIKKLAKGAKKSRDFIGQMRSGGSKALCRRNKSWNRVGRAIARENVRRLEICRQVLKDIDAYEPKDEEERLGLEGIKERVIASIARRERRIKWRAGEPRRRCLMEKAMRLKVDKDSTWESMKEQLALFGSFVKELSDVRVVPK